MPLRILDANLNRAREAARVLEDAARFAVADAGLTESLKGLRHELTAAAALLPPLGGARDTPGDVGTGLWGAGERHRTSMHAVATAAARRLGEALRCLEEFGKLVDDRFAERMKALRYRSYDIEQRLLLRLAPTAVRQWRVCVLVTESLCRHHPWDAVVTASLDGGADAIQLREKGLSDRELLRRARRVVDLCRDRASAIINDRPDVALAAGAHGVHLGQDDLPIADVRRMVGHRLLVGVSTHSMDEAARAIAGGADVCGVGAMFPSSTKSRSPSGAEYLRQFLAAHPGVPHLAIGGIGPDNVDSLVQAGCRGVAVASSVCGAGDPRAVVDRLVATLSASPGPSRDRSHAGSPTP